VTKEEIKELKGLAASMGLYDDKNPCKRAVILGKAIKELEQEPCEDAISRQAAIDVLAIGEEFLKRVLDEVDVIGHEREKYEWGLGLVESYISDMEELPSVNPQPKTGHWIKVENDQCWWYECDQCHNEPLKDKWTHDDVLSAWCSCCGAKMEESEESE